MTNLKYEVWMNDIALSSFSKAIYVSAIQYKPAEMEISTNDIANRHGEWIDGIRRKGTTVTVSFIMKKTDIVDRQTVVQAVAGWASKGILKTSDRPWQQLHVRCVEPPFVTDTCDWTQPITMTFQAFEHPFWEERTPAEASLSSGTSGSGTMYVPGNVGSALVEATVTPGSSTVNNITLTVGDTSITLTGVSATSSQPVTITYDENGIQSIKRGTTSILDKRTGSDDLLAECGQLTTVSFTASAAASVSFRARGLWL